MFPIRLTLEGESVFLESRKALLLSGSRSKSAADRSMIREWSFWKSNGKYTQRWIFDFGGSQEEHLRWQKSIIGMKIFISTLCGAQHSLKFLFVASQLGVRILIWVLSKSPSNDKYLKKAIKQSNHLSSFLKISNNCTVGWGGAIFFTYLIPSTGAKRSPDSSLSLSKSLMSSSRKKKIIIMWIGNNCIREFGIALIFSPFFICASLFCYFTLMLKREGYKTKYISTY